MDPNIEKSHPLHGLLEKAPINPIIGILKVKVKDCNKGSLKSRKGDNLPKSENVVKDTMLLINKPYLHCMN